MFHWQRLFKAFLGLCLCLGGFVWGGADIAIAQTYPQAKTNAPAVEEPVITASADSGASLFTVQCAGCHANGGNIIRRGKTLKLKALKRYGYDDVTAITALVAQGKGAMPAFVDRLTPAEIDAIAQYVQQQASEGW